MRRRSFVALAVVAAALGGLALGEKLWAAPAPPPPPVVKVPALAETPPEDPRCPCPPGTTQRRREGQLEAGAIELWCEDGRGVHEGPSRSWWPNGQLRKDVPYRNGVAEGVCATWYPDGRPESRRTFRNGKLDGISQRWLENGKLTSEVRFDMDRAVGVGRYRDEGGRLERTRDFAKPAPPLPHRAALNTAGGVTLRQLGDVRPGAGYRGETGKQLVDRTPIVLWAGTRPAAVLALSVETRGRSVVQRISPIAPASLPGFPVVVRSETPVDRSADEPDGIEPRALVAADLDGDGVQELVVGRARGGVDVYALRGRVAAYPSPAASQGRAFHFFLAQRFEVDGRDVVYVLSDRAGDGEHDGNLLLRVDERGVTRVRLEGLERTELLALGAIQRSGSPDVDELLALVPDGASEAAVVRLRPDGKRIGALRLYVQPPRAAFWFIRRSRRAVLAVPGKALVITPDEPVNGIRQVAVLPEAPPAELRERLHLRDAPPVHAALAFVADADGDPKLVYRVDGALWAVDHLQRCFTPAAGGRWAPLPGREPFRMLTVPLEETLWRAWVDDDERLLAMTVRETGKRRPVTHDEWREAGDRYRVQTTFTLVDGATASSVSVPGALPRELETQLDGGFEYRLHDGKLTAVMALEKTDAAGQAPPAFYAVEAPLVARR